MATQATKQLVDQRVREVEARAKQELAREIEEMERALSDSARQQCPLVSFMLPPRRAGEVLATGASTLGSTA
jgi:hypothetical protein